MRSGFSCSVLAKLAPCALACALPALACADDVAPLIVPSILEAPSGPPAKPWQFVGLAHQTKPMTEFSVVEEGGEKAIRIVADHSYGNLVSFGHQSLTRQTTLSWQWRLDKPNPLADLHSKGGDDVPVKVCVMFDYDVTHLPFSERVLLKVARANFDGPVPAATLCYVWDHNLPVGTSLMNAFTSRIHYIVVESGDARLHQWLHVSRSVAVDFQHTFGPEFQPASPDELPPIAGVAIGADTDNTATVTESYVTDLHLKN